MAIPQKGPDRIIKGWRKHNQHYTVPEKLARILLVIMWKIEGNKDGWMCQRKILGKDASCVIKGRNQGRHKCHKNRII